MKALIFDLDGTLVDTVQHHVVAWQTAMAESDLSVDAADIHNRIGMSGRLLMEECAREVGRKLSANDMDRMDSRHSALFAQAVPAPRALNGALSLLRHLRDCPVQIAIATSGKRPDIDSSLGALSVPPDVVVISGQDAPNAKPEPDLFLAAQKRLAVPVSDCFVVGDSIWDILAARRAGFLAVGLLCGGSNSDDLYRACAFRVYQGPAQLQRSLKELGIN